MTTLHDFTGTVHPAADLFPMMQTDEFQALCEDIAAHGLREALVVDEDGALLDGRNRLAACNATRTRPFFRTHAGDPIAFVVSTNLHRRHLTVGQKAELSLRIEAAYAVEAAKNVGGRPRKDDRKPPASLPEVSPEDRESRTRAAKIAGVSPRSVSKQKRLREKAPDLADQVASGAVALDRAAKELARRERAEAAQTRDQAQQAAPLPERRFAVILADPPWRYEHSRTDSRKIENHYPTMSAEDLAALDVPAADDSVLFMWATSPKLAEALDLMKAWQFDYRTCMVWVKDKIGMGYFARQQHELVLIGARGNLPVPEPGARPSSVFNAPRGVHSAKPPVMHELVETMYPDLSRIELFARTARPGWVSWGNDPAVNE